MISNDYLKISGKKFTSRLIVGTGKYKNMKEEYDRDELVRFRVFAWDYSVERSFKRTRLPLESKSLILEKTYFQIRDALTNEIIIPFDSINNSTRLSTDSKGMWFNFYMDSLTFGRTYEIDLKVIEKGSTQIFNNIGGRFRIA